MKRRGSVALLLGALLVAGSVLMGEPFKDGETVCFVGDSITHGGHYHEFIALYYQTRFPDRRIRFVNAGTSGETARGGLARMPEDVVPYKPTTATVMFGMNDVNRGAYPLSPTEKNLTDQKSALDGYAKNMAELVKHLKADAGVQKFIYITPSPYDQTVMFTNRSNDLVTCNDGLTRCAEIVREMAAKDEALLVDFHKPMTAFNLERQKADPAYTIVGNDRIHPGEPGHLMMAWLFLKAQGALSAVSRMAVDAGNGRVTTSDNATVSDVAKKADGVTFTALEKALPYPVHPRAAQIAPYLPIEAEMNQEILSVGGLPEGTYAVKIDGTEVGRFAAQELAKGINLAMNDKTPQYKQAGKALWTNEKLWGTKSMLRSLFASRWWWKNHEHWNVEDMKEIQARYDAMPNKTNNYGAYMMRNYLENWSRVEDIKKEAAALTAQLFEMCQPIPHMYEVSQVQ